MNARKQKLVAIVMLIAFASVAQARTKLTALPERAATVIRLDNPAVTLIEEERVLTLQQGLNKVDFSWKGVNIDSDSIRLQVLDNPEKVKLLNVSYPPNEAALVWEIASENSFAETVRISYLLHNIDRLITYKAIADKQETFVDLKSFLILRNFSGEDFDMASVLLDYGEAFEKGIDHEETKQLLFLKKPKVPVTKIWKFDSAKQPWDPEKLENKNVGIPVSYRILNNIESGLGEFALWGGKARLFQDDGHESTIFLGEDVTGMVPVGEKTELYIGDSRDIVVTQRKMKDEKVNVRYNNKRNIILYDNDEVITAKIENFKDKPAVLTMIQHIPGQWKMLECTLDKKKLVLGEDYKKKDAYTLEFEINLDNRTESGPFTRNLKMHYQRLNIRP
ncbi:MAG: hypothetical protein ACYSWP_01900 [Planctomycetota bacterium]|jgi:hypothetical protein